MNRLIVTGRLVRDPVVRYSDAGKIVYTFSIAVRRVAQIEGKQTADFFDCVAFGVVGEQMNKCDLKKGVKILLDGEVRIESYNAKDGTKRVSTRVVAHNFELFEPKSQSREVAANSDYANASENSYSGVYGEDDSDGPF